MTIVEAVVTFVWGVMVISAAIYMAAQNIRLRVRLYRLENELKRAMIAVREANEAVDNADRRVDAATRTLSGVFPKKRVAPLPPSSDNWAEIIEDTKP